MPVFRAAYFEDAKSHARCLVSAGYTGTARRMTMLIEEIEDLREVVLAARMADFLLTTAEGDNIPHGESCKLAVRTLLREALAVLDTQDARPVD